MTLENQQKALKLLLAAFDASCLAHDCIWDMAINKSTNLTQVEIAHKEANKIVSALLEVENLLRDLPTSSVGEAKQDKP